MVASGYNPIQTDFIRGILGDIGYIGKIYLPIIYEIQSINPVGLITTHPVDNEVVDNLLDVNYYKVAMKIYRKANIIIEKVNNTDSLDYRFLYDKDVRFFVENSKGQFGDLFLQAVEMTNDNIEHEVFINELVFFIISGIAIIFMFYMIFRIIPLINKSYLFSKKIISLYKTLPSKYFNEQMNEITDQIDDICENYDVEDSGLEKKFKNKKKSTTKNQKVLFLCFCGIITVIIIIPFTTILLFNNKCKNLMDFLVHSTRRGYYTASVNIKATELIINDYYYYSVGEQLRLLLERYDQLTKLEAELKEGKYGGKSGSDYEIFSKLNNNPGCVRFSMKEHICALREFKNFYTQDIANSPIDYLMVEYLSRLNEFINNGENYYFIYNYTVKEEVNKLLKFINENPYIEVLSKLSEDIVGHVDKMNELGSEYLINEAKKYLRWTLMLHALETFLIYITFYIFISRPIKHQLRLMDNITNISFSIPSSVYNTSPRFTTFIEHGKLNE
ncbi:hypothetical protein H8356DRAFT_1312021 [Neocallimastix lanati (nom. inval.)]|nr:hypothetical protein H8356DRAFT_1312021 [Neocallimastix sp. JGI-2020a]